MYEQKFGLARNPFGMTADPGFLFLTDAHREALAGLIHVVLNKRGMALLTGDAGTGKTTLLRTLAASVPAALAQFCVLVHSTLPPSDFLEMVLAGFGVQVETGSKARALRAFQVFLERMRAENRLGVLVVDEAHVLSAEVLEEIRLLSNLEQAGDKLLQVVLAAQTELDATLRRHSLRQLKQRIAYRFVLRPLAPEQVAAYVNFRWMKAGGKDRPPFSDDALDYLVAFSRGIPRVINAVCDNALLLAFSEDCAEVQPEHVVVVAKDLAIEEGPAAVDISGVRDDVATMGLAVP